MFTRFYSASSLPSRKGCKYLWYVFVENQNRLSGVSKIQQPMKSSCIMQEGQTLQSPDRKSFPYFCCQTKACVTDSFLTLGVKLASIIPSLHHELPLSCELCHKMVSSAFFPVLLTQPWAILVKEALIGCLLCAGPRDWTGCTVCCNDALTLCQSVSTQFFWSWWDGSSLAIRAPPHLWSFVRHRLRTDLLTNGD